MMACKGKWAAFAQQGEEVLFMAREGVPGAQSCIQEGCDARINQATRRCIRGHAQQPGEQSLHYPEELDGLLCALQSVAATGLAVDDDQRMWNARDFVHSGASSSGAYTEGVTHVEAVLALIEELREGKVRDMTDDPRVLAAQGLVQELGKVAPDSVPPESIISIQHAFGVLIGDRLRESGLAPALYFDGAKGELSFQSKGGLAPEAAQRLRELGFEPTEDGCIVTVSQVNALVGRLQESAQAAWVELQETHRSFNEKVVTFSDAYRLWQEIWVFEGAYNAVLRAPGSGFDELGMAQIRGGMRIDVKRVLLAQPPSGDIQGLGEAEIELLQDPNVRYAVFVGGWMFDAAEHLPQVAKSAILVEQAAVLLQNVVQAFQDREGTTDLSELEDRPFSLDETGLTGMTGKSEQKRAGVLDQVVEAGKLLGQVIPGDEPNDNLRRVLNHVLDAKYRKDHRLASVHRLYDTLVAHMLLDEDAYPLALLRGCVEVASVPLVRFATRSELRAVISSFAAGATRPQYGAGRIANRLVGTTRQSIRWRNASGEERTHRVGDLVQAPWGTGVRVGRIETCLFRPDGETEDGYPENIVPAIQVRVEVPANVEGEEVVSDLLDVDIAEITHVEA